MVGQLLICAALFETPDKEGGTSLGSPRFLSLYGDSPRVDLTYSTVPVLSQDCARDVMCCTS